MKNQKAALFLSFNGNAGEAMNFYASTLPNAEVTRLERYGEEHPSAGEGDENRVLHGALSIMGQEIIFLDRAQPIPRRSSTGPRPFILIAVTKQSLTPFLTVCHKAVL